MTVPICFVDTETTDVGPRRLAWELAIIRREPDGTRKELQTFIEVDLTDANPFALKVGRFHDRHPLGRWLAGADDLGDGVKQYGDGTPIPFGFPAGATTGGYIEATAAAALWCRWTHGAHVIGAVPNFDTEVMGTAARGAGLLATHHYHLGDVENLAAGYMLGRAASDPSISSVERARLTDLGTPPWSSDSLFAELGVVIPEEDRHTALGDARGCERAYDLIAGPVALAAVAR